MLRRKLETGEKRSRAEDLQSWKYEAAVLHQENLKLLILLFQDLLPKNVTFLT
jgi:hypothetical protein